MRVAGAGRDEEAELADGVVRRLHGLRALLPADPYADVRALDHRHVVRAVADAERVDPPGRHSFL